MAAVTQIDVSHEIAQAFATMTPRRARNVAAATKAGVLALLEMLVSEDYLTARTAEIKAGADYFTAFNRGWVQPAGERWANGARYMKHAITPSGRAVLDLLRTELAPAVEAPEPPEWDEYSAEWLRALAAQDAARAEVNAARDREYLEALADQRAVASAGVPF